jgi:hypothetical protein
MAAEFLMPLFTENMLQLAELSLRQSYTEQVSSLHGILEQKLAEFFASNGSP